VLDAHARSLLNPCATAAAAAAAVAINLPCVMSSYYWLTQTRSSHPNHCSQVDGGS